MALSQIQCLDHNNVNWRSSETKPEFFYSEEQRLALEALLSSGQDAFYGVIKKEKIRDFLSERELTKILNKVEAFDPDSGYFRTGGDKGEQYGEDDPKENVEHSLEYWPMRSDCSIPELDLGWPDTVAYRGVTRATVYMQPPLDGQPHIKEVVRKMITNAQRVIAVVMDIFTDVDIFKDMLDAAFKRKISVYIILNETDIKYFLQMCERAQMHKGHLKNLRIRSAGGSEFYTRFSTKFKGSLSQRFMFVDGDKAVCGSYSFTWSAARIDRNIITVLSGQVVESFDHQFQDLYLLSKGVSLKGIPMDKEPEPEHIILPASMPTGPSEAIAKKLINPKYALVKTKSASDTKAESKTENMAMKIKVKAVEQPMDEPSKHPALQDMERANMFDYLPTWVEPDPQPGSDILGYINIIDPNIKNAQPSQMNRIKICDTSHATAQFMLLSKEQELRNAQKQEDSMRTQEETTLKVKRQESYYEKERAANSRGEGTMSRQGSRDEHSALNHVRGTLSRESSKNEESMPIHGKMTISREGSKDVEIAPCHGRRSRSRESSKEKQPVSAHGKGTVSREGSLDEETASSHGKGTKSSQDEGSAAVCKKGSISGQGSKKGTTTSSHGKEYMSRQGSKEGYSSSHGKVSTSRQGSQDEGSIPNHGNRATSRRSSQGNWSASSHGNRLTSRQGSQGEGSVTSHGNRATSRQGSQGKGSVSSHGNRATFRQGSQGTGSVTSHGNRATSRQGSQGEGSVYIQGNRATSRQGSQGEGSVSSHGNRATSRQGSQGKGSASSHVNRATSRQDSQGEGSTSSHGNRVASRQGSQGEVSLASTGHVSLGASDPCEDFTVEHMAAEQLEDVHADDSQKFEEGFTPLAEDQTLEPNNKGQGNGPPVPKPRTLPVTDFISMKNAMNVRSGRTSTEGHSMHSVNGVDADEREEENMDQIVIPNGPTNHHHEEHDPDEFDLIGLGYSSSGSGSLPPSNASSMSEEYYPNTTLQRRNSDHISHRDHFAIHRKMSDGHISRGSFVRPLNLSRSMIETRHVENGKSRNYTLEEELKRALGKGHQIERKERIYTMDPSQVCIGVSDHAPQIDTYDPLAL
ncbi:protein FAM83G [Rhinophrynus dorsalis]